MSPSSAPTQPTWWRTLSALLALVVAVALGWRGLTQPPAPAQDRPDATPWPTLAAWDDGEAPVEIYRTAAWTVYFTRPDRARARTHRGGPDAYLVQALRSAQRTIDMAIYDLDLWSVRDALLDAHRRGVRVRLVVDQDHVTPEVQALQAAGIPVVVDTGKGLMHHKFVVLDGVEVWTGSMNFTVNGAYRHANHLLQVSARRLAADYLREFEEMFVEGRFGPRSQADTPYPQVKVNGVVFEAWFAPDEHPQKRLVSLLRMTEDDILLLAFIWTADPLTDALLEAYRRGVQVQGWLEEEQLDAPGADYERLRAAGMDLHPDPLPGMMHHKVLVLDGEIVVLGSYNFTRAADVRNDENVLVVHDAQLANALFAWWQHQRAAWP